METNFDETPYRVSFDEFRFCFSRPAAISRWQGLLGELKSAMDRGNSAEDRLRRSEEDLDQLVVRLKDLVSLYDKLVGLPIVGEVIKWDWFDLKTKVAPASVELLAAVQSKRKALNESLTKVVLQHSNLEANISDFAKLPCSVEGRYEGLITQNWSGKSSKGHITINVINNQYFCIIGGETSSAPCCALNISSPPNTMNFNTSCDTPREKFRSYFSLGWSADFLALSGSGQAWVQGRGPYDHSIVYRLVQPLEPISFDDPTGGNDVPLLLAPAENSK